MTTPSQRQVFLEGEGNAWFNRNRRSDVDNSSALSKKDYLVQLLEDLPLPSGPEVSVFEVGCGQGLRLARFKSSMGWSVAGLSLV